MTARILQWSLHQLSLNRKVAIATVVSTAGSVPGKMGARLALTHLRLKAQWAEQDWK